MALYKFIIIIFLYIIIIIIIQQTTFLSTALQSVSHPSFSSP